MNAPQQAGLPPLPLKDPKLFREQCYLDGAWTGADSKKTFAVHNPATGEALGSAPDLGVAETKRAIEASERALPAWRAKTAKERSAILRKWNDLILANLEDLALLLTSEQGKPLAESKGEIQIGAAYIEWFAEEAKRIYGDTIPTPWADRRIVVIKQPVGVCAAITPSNFPHSMITRKIAPALAAGCTVVLKPGQTCVCANRLFVHDAVYDKFAAKLVEKVKALQVSPGTEAGAMQGPLIDANALAKVEEHVADATSGGAKVLTGGRRHARGGTFYEPTVLAGGLPAMKDFPGGTFWPAAPRVRVKNDAAASS